MFIMLNTDNNNDTHAKNNQSDDTVDESLRVASFFDCYHPWYCALTVVRQARCDVKKKSFWFLLFTFIFFCVDYFSCVANRRRDYCELMSEVEADEYMEKDGLFL
jgi:hypothetical protein